MSAFFKKRWVLAIVLIVFTICKLPHLHYAYYWDECWPYASAVKDMYVRGISLLPGAMNTDLSRGHPLLFHALAAGWMRIFGPSHESAHSFALFVSLLYLIAVYEAALRLFNLRVAIISLVLVCTQMIFFVQSSFLLPEVMVSFFGFLSLYFFVKDRYWLTALFLTALFFTKESGLVMGFVLGAAAFAGLFDSKTEWRTRLYRIASIAVPCVMIVLFFIIQKHVKGWYLYPYHSSLIEHSWVKFWFNFRINCLAGVFLYDLRYYDFWLLVLISIVAAIKNKNARYLIFILPGILLYYMVDYWRSERALPKMGLLFFGMFVFSMVLTLYFIIKLKFHENVRQKKFMVLCCIFIFCFLVFSSLNFFTPRYLLTIVVPLLFFVAVLLDRVIERAYKWIFYPALLAILVTSYFAFKTDNSYGDCDMGAFDGLRVQQDVVGYFEQNSYYDKFIGCSNLEHLHLTEPTTGFRNNDTPFTNVSWFMNGNCDFAIFDNIEKDYRYDEVKKDTAFHLVKRFQKGLVWAEVYERKK